MRISFNWLKEMVVADLDARTVAERLTLAGLAVDTIEEVGTDTVFEFDITSNRPDALSHFGIAREVAALFDVPLSAPASRFDEVDPSSSSLTSVTIEAPELCPRYVARLVRGVKIGPSPDWMVRRLETLGQRSINNVADVTNYVLLEQGHPLHAFDFNRLGGNRIVVRRATPGERIVTLEKLATGDEFREIELRDDMLVIADANAPVAIAGIKGGKGTGISDETVDVLLEAAYFQPASVRRTARALKLDTDASHRFERGADIDATVRAIDRAASLIVEVAGGTVCRGAVDTYPAPVVRTPIPLRRARVEALLGYEVPFDRMVDALRGLGFAVEPLRDTEELLAVGPSYRVDIAIEEDLVEEVARSLGYGLVPPTLPPWGGAGEYLPGERARQSVRDALRSRGYSEAISLSFVDRNLDDEFVCVDLERDSSSGVDLVNPVLDNKPRMRSSLVTGLIEAYETNSKHGTRNVQLFEIGKRFLRPLDGLRPVERETLGILLAGMIEDGDYRGRRESDFYDMKGAIEAVLRALRIASFTFDRASVECLHPGQSARVVLDGQVLGVFGRVSPSLAAKRKFRSPLFLAELALDRMLEVEAAPVAYRRLPRFPAVGRDVSIVVPKSINFQAVVTAVNQLGIADLRGFVLYDIFTGGNLPEDHHSMTLRATFRSDERTLTDDEVSVSHGRIVDELATRFGADLR